MLRRRITYTVFSWELGGFHFLGSWVDLVVVDGMLLVLVLLLLLDSLIVDGDTCIWCDDGGDCIVG